MSESVGKISSSAFIYIQTSWLQKIQLQKMLSKILFVFYWLMLQHHPPNSYHTSIDTWEHLFPPPLRCYFSMFFHWEVKERASRKTLTISTLKRHLISITHLNQQQKKKNNWSLQRCFHKLKDVQPIQTKVGCLDLQFDPQYSYCM